MIKYSIIIPCYNVEQYISECLESLLLQSYKDYEVIVIDDCSKDGTLLRLQKYKERFDNYRIIHLPYNKGVSTARNEGIKVAQGKYILFVDSDDYVSRDYIETIDKNDGKDIDLLSFGHFDYILEHDNCYETKESKMNFDKKLDWETLLISSFFASPWNKRYSAYIIKTNDISFEEGMVCYEDLIFNLKYCKYINNFELIKKPIYYYRQFNTINGNRKRKWPSPFEISDAVYCAIKEFYETKVKIDDLYLYPFASYFIELSFADDKKELKKIIAELIRNSYFNNTIYHLHNKGKRVELLSYALNKKIGFLSYQIIKSLIRK